MTPNKVAFLKKEIREGIIPKILIEFLMTRIMIKKSTKLVLLKGLLSFIVFQISKDIEITYI